MTTWMRGLVLAVLVAGGAGTPIQEHAAHFLIGAWRGTIEYVDYGDDRTRFSLPTLLVFTTDGDDVVLEFEYEEPDGETVTGTDRIVQTGDRMTFAGDWRLAARTTDAAGDIDRMELHQEGRDNNRDAALRTVVVREGDDLTITRWVRYAGTDDEFMRHEYRLSRARE